MKKVMTRDAFHERLETISGDMQSDVFIDFQRLWSSRGINFYGRMTQDQWDFVMREFVPLMASAVVHERPARFGAGSRTVWGMIGNAVEEKFSERDVEDLVEALRKPLDEEWLNELRERPTFVRMAEEYVNCWDRYHELAAAIEEYGFESVKTSLADHGMSKKEIGDVKKIIDGFRKEIDDASAPPAGKAPLIQPPTSGKWPKLDDDAYVQYLKDLKSRYESGIDALTGWGGIALEENASQRMMENLADFDYAAVRATLGEQKRWPPEGQWVDDFYEKLAKLPELVAKNIEEHSAEEISRRITDCVDMLKRDDELARNEGFTGLRRLHRLLNWLTDTVPGIESRALVDARAGLAREFEPRWAAASGGPAHDRFLGQIVFTSNPGFPQLDEVPPTAINPVKDSIYAHVFLDRPLNAISTGMLFLEAGDDRFIMQIGQFPNKDSAYVRLDLLPDSDVGKNPELVQFFGKALESAGGELECVITPAGEKLATGTLKLEFGKTDAGKLGKHVEKIAAAAEENRTRDAVLPEIFTKPFKPYKDKVLALEQLVAAIEGAWERNTYGEKIKVTAVRVNHYKGPGKEWREEFNPFKEPVQRLTDSFVGIVYETSDGKTRCVEDGIQFRQFYTRGKGYGTELDVLFWGLKPFTLPTEQVKRVASK